MPTYSVTGPDGKTYSIDGPAGATQEQVVAQIQAAQKSAPQPAASPPGLMERVKNAVIAPEAERDKSLGEAVVGGIMGAPEAIGTEFMANARKFGQDLAPQSKEEFEKAPRGVFHTLTQAGDVLGMAMAIPKGGLTSIVGRPVEQQTGLRRGITGGILSAAVPFGGEASAAGDAAKLEKAAAALKPGVLEAHAAGYVLPPKMISDKPGIIANTLAGWSGKIKTAQAASAKNQQVTNTLAAKSLGLDDGAELSKDVFKTIRADAGKAYEALPKALPQINADQDYVTAVSGLGGASSEAAALFPKITKNHEIIDLADELKSVPQFPTEIAVELVKKLRKDGAANLKAFSDPSKQALGFAQRDAAEAIDDLIGRNLSASGQEDLLKAYTDARVKIAKSYDVEGATNAATGNVDAGKIAKLAAKGKPLSGELKTIAEAHAAFPKALQSAEKFGEVEPLSVLDMGTAALATAHGNPAIGVGMLTRPIARAAVLSKPAQNALVGERGATALDTNVLRRAPAANAFSQLTQPSQN